MGNHGESGKPQYIPEQSSNPGLTVSTPPQSLALIPTPTSLDCYKSGPVWFGSPKLKEQIGAALFTHLFSELRDAQYLIGKLRCPHAAINRQIFFPKFISIPYLPIKSIRLVLFGSTQIYAPFGLKKQIPRDTKIPNFRKPILQVIQIC